MKFFIKYLLVLALVIWFLVLMSCWHNPKECSTYNEESFIHTCPQEGHGACPICKNDSEQVDLSVLEYCCIDCELVYEYEIYIDSDY